jgi:aminoglycoside phosphotransferase (APT) family kinase protein
VGAVSDEVADLAVALERVIGAGPVTGLRRLTAGASRETWTFEAGAQPLVLRRDPPGRQEPAVMAKEAACLRAAAEAGVPVPPVRLSGDGSDGVGTPYLVMDHVAGETLAPRLLRDDRYAAARRALPSELGRVLARIHRTPPVPGLTRSDRLADLRAQHDGFGEARPAVELALRWLAEHRPDPVAPTLVHGDFRNGNLVVGEDGLRAVLDWELARVGDPREDLGWLCAKVWRFGAAEPVGGFGPREELFAGYAEVAGTGPDAGAVHWWEVFAAVHWAVICRVQAERHLSGAETSVELAVLGRRAAEAEHDALLTLGLTAAAEVPDPLTTPADPGPDVLRERPGADELLEAVTTFLRTEAGGDERTRYLARVAATGLAAVRRELRVGDAERAAHTARLAALGCRDDAELAAGLRAGTLAATDPAVVEAVRAATTARVMMSNPRYLAAPP